MTITKRTLTNLKKLGLTGLDSILLYLPIKYRDYRKPLLKIEDSMVGNGAHYLKLQVKSITINESARPARVQLMLTDGYQDWSGFIFGNTRPWKDVHPGQTVNISAKPVYKDRFKNLNSIELVPSTHQGKIVPFYKGKKGLITSDTIWNSVTVALASEVEENIKYIESQMGLSEAEIFEVVGNDLKSFEDFFMAIHRPRSTGVLRQSIVVAKKINALFALKKTLDSTTAVKNEESIINYSTDTIKSVLAKMPFQMTRSQKKAIWEISQDLYSDTPMNRLLNGDVGFGKTAAYGVPAICAQKAGKNVVIVMPNTILANQVADEIENEFGGDVLLVTEATSKSVTRPSSNPIIVGTTAIINKLQAFGDNYSIDFLIIDEQQKMGASQKKLLMQPHTNVLEGTATAVPQTMALTMFGNRPVSVLEDCPVDKRIESSIYDKNTKKEGFQRLQKVLEDGGQIAVVYPRLDRSVFYRFTLPASEVENLQEHRKAFKKVDYNLVKEEELPDGSLRIKTRVTPKNKSIPFNVLLKKICPEARELEQYKDDGALATGQVRNIEQALPEWESRFPGKVAALHSDMSEQAKADAIMSAKNGDYDIYLASLIIEIGITIPNLRGIMVLGADKMGASTLHQLRGRLARKGGDGVFMMCLDKPKEEYNQETLERLRIVRDNMNGFKIAELDMYQRGFGELSAGGSKQSGNVESIFYNIKVKPQELSAFNSSEEARRFCEQYTADCDEELAKSDLTS